MGLVGHADLLTAIAKQQGLPTTVPGMPGGVLEPDRRDREATTAPPIARRTGSDERVDGLKATAAISAVRARRQSPIALFVVLLVLATCALAWEFGLHGRAWTPRSDVHP
jgi:hypothetical protein